LCSKSRRARQMVYKWLWKLVILERIRAWLWKVKWEGVTTKLFLSRRNLANDMRCPKCRMHAKETQHLLTEWH